MVDGHVGVVVGFGLGRAALVIRLFHPAVEFGAKLPQSPGVRGVGGEVAQFPNIGIEVGELLWDSSWGKEQALRVVEPTGGLDFLSMRVE